jgi:CysZ protein
MGLFTGIAYFIQSIFMLLSKPRFLGLALIPILVTLGISMASIWISFQFSDEALTYLWGEKSESWVWNVLDYLLGGAGAILSLFITPWLVILIGFPLCEPLAAAIDESLGGVETQISFWESFITGIRNSLALVVLGLTGSIMLILLGLIPGLSLITVPINFLVWTPMILVFDLCDSIFVRRNMNFSQRKHAIFSRKFASISVGLVALALITPPFVNLLGLPIAICMGTLHARSLSV